MMIMMRYIYIFLPLSFIYFSQAGNNFRDQIFATALRMVRSDPVSLTFRFRFVAIFSFLLLLCIIFYFHDICRTRGDNVGWDALCKYEIVRKWTFYRIRFFVNGNDGAARIVW